MYFTPFPRIGFFSPSITRFVLPTQGQLEDCFQPPVSSPTHHALLCAWPSTPVRFVYNMCHLLALCACFQNQDKRGVGCSLCEWLFPFFIFSFCSFQSVSSLIR